VAFSQDDRRLAVTHVHGMVDICDTENLRETTYRTGEPGMFSLAFLPDGQRVATGGIDRLVMLTDVDTGRQILVFRELSHRCRSLAFSPNGHRLAAASSDGAIHIWDATPRTGDEDQSFRTLDCQGEVWAMTLSPNGRSLVSGGKPIDSAVDQNAHLRAWSLPGFEGPIELPGLSIIVFGIDYDPTGRLLVICGDSLPISGQALIKVWDRELGREAFPVEALGKEGTPFFGVIFSRDGRWLIGASDARLAVWDARTGRKVSLLGSHGRFITGLAASPDGRFLASFAHDNLVKLWDATQLHRPQKPLREFPAQAGLPSDVVAFSQDGARLVVATDDDSATIHHLDGADAPIPLIKRGHQPIALAFSPDGRWVASGGVDSAIVLWDSRTGDLLRVLKGHVDQVNRLRFIKRPDGLWIASGSRDQTIKVWDVTPPAAP
jgi:WD40 repeat protein